MLADALTLTLQLAIVALIALPVVGLVLRTNRFETRDGHVRLWAAPHAMRVAAAGPSQLPQLNERVFATTRARSPGR